jgi:hypothetical protein
VGSVLFTHDIFRGVGPETGTSIGILMKLSYCCAEQCSPQPTGISKVRKVSGPSFPSPSPNGFVLSRIQNRSGSGCFGQNRARLVLTEKCDVRTPYECLALQGRTEGPPPLLSCSYSQRSSGRLPSPFLLFSGAFQRGLVPLDTVAFKQAAVLRGSRTPRR